MAQKSQRWEDNAEGRFYTDKTCILCCLCADLAPGNFRESVDGDHDVVYKQPETEQEEQQCMEALQACPVEAIGQDGVSNAECRIQQLSAISSQPSASQLSAFSRQRRDGSSSYLRADS